MSYRIWEIQFAGSPKVVWSQVKPTPEQLAIVSQLGVQVNPDDTFAVVASRILEEVGHVIGCPPRDVSDRQHELAEELEIDISTSNSSWSAFVRIKEAIQLSNLEAVERMALGPGDVVIESEECLQKRIEGPLGDVFRRLPRREYVVSSVGPDGQVFFKGGGQAPAPLSVQDRHC